MSNSTGMTNRKRIIKKVFVDYALTFASSLVTVGIIQLLVYPVLAQKLGNDQYGIFLTIIGIINALMPSFGSSLRNTHIVRSDDYEQQECEYSDFTRIAIFVVPIVSVLATIVIYIAFSISLFELFLVALLLFCGILKAYCLVVYRLPIQPVKNLIVSCVSGAGYLAGMACFVLSGYWAIPFLFAEFFGLIYILKTTRILRGGIEATVLFQSSLRTYNFLTVSNIVSYCSVYIDRFLLFPLLGSASVSTYYASSYLGKASAFLLSPFSTLLLSYISDGTGKMTLKRYSILNLLLLLGIIAFYLVLMLISPWITAWLYPSLLSDALPYMIFGNAASLLAIANSLNLTILLKVAPSKWQLIISISKLVVYIFAIIIGVTAHGLLGFCVALMLSNFFIYVSTYIVGMCYMLNGEVKPKEMKA